MHTRIGFDQADVRPIRFSRVHLRSGPAVNGQCLDATVLKSLGKINNEGCSVRQKEMLLVPSKTGLNRNRGVWNCFYDSLCDVENAWNILQHACSGTFAGNLLDWTTKVDVEYVRMCLIHYDTGRLAHRLDIFAVNLYGDRSFFRADLQFQQAFVHHSDEGVARHELRIDHSCPHLSTKQAKADVRHILHRSQQNRAVAKVDIAYLHRFVSGVLSFYLVGQSVHLHLFEHRTKSVASRR